MVMLLPHDNVLYSYVLPHVRSVNDYGPELAARHTLISSTIWLPGVLPPWQAGEEFACTAKTFFNRVEKLDQIKCNGQQLLIIAW